MVIPTKLLIAASGTGGHLFPAIALAEQLPDYEIEWLGVPNRLETQLVPAQYPLHKISVAGFQEPLGIGTLRNLTKIASSVFQVRQLLQQGSFQGVFTTGGYIAAPAVMAARSLGIPVILPESNAIPGKVTRFFSSFCTAVALGFEPAAQYLPRIQTIYTGTPVRSQFLSEKLSPLDLPIPDNVFLIVVVGGSQGAVAVNQLIRQCAPAWFDGGVWIVHLTGNNDPDVASLQHPQYFPLLFYDNMASLLQRANLAIGRSGAGTVTELAITRKPAIFIPLPTAAEDHQFYNAQVLAASGAAIVFRQKELTPAMLQTQVLELLHSPEDLQKMADAAGKMAVFDSAERLAKLVRELVH
ncbi:undecaprenyldiphospho-muramoylpentapeptide beta-N-acetylglucosaminyltransferase [Gloeocapsopsis crepidinum]|uniref:undecaprenyldiphospho-muramoylpentapeptide beta-N-acetylglucosaminyltransferase n=1 Tax=Gloeocapsopsis crepidinum TaxID=693223 RepID=UPI003F71FD66